MQYNPGTAGAPPPIEPAGFFTGVQIRPVILGVVVDTVATLVLSTFYFMFYVTKDLTEKGDAMEDAFTAYWTSSEGLIASLVIGSLGTMIGGFYAAHKAGALQIKHGALVGVGAIILGLAFSAAGTESELPDWFMALAYGAAIPAGALGGYFAEMLKEVGGEWPRPGGSRH
ncbi:MAG TPA: YrzE family protein [Verrucomicrobiae bacterium]|jgi:putative membrane protein (TIGR04086 family)|nr:YrzE family protein [Verrucomicrobiae bacterium]